MERFYLEKPSLSRKNQILEYIEEMKKDEIIEYLDEFIKYNSNINGTGSLDKIYDGYTFEEALERCLNMKNEWYAKSINRVPGKTFLLIRKDDNKIVGTINIRWNLSEKMLKFGGHIGYGIRPTERRKGYNKIQLYLVLLEAQKLNLDKVMLDCSVDNLGSDKTIKALGGILERCELDEADNTMTNVYWINVDESIKKYKDKYSKYIM